MLAYIATSVPGCSSMNNEHHIGMTTEKQLPASA
uniref:Uncharacterized protein n=1 Tax=Anopheles minimus TaxID=112268 RepID=A0A182WQ34_9DIPT